jgi:hypothetical protein
VEWQKFSDNKLGVWIGVVLELVFYLVDRLLAARHIYRMMMRHWVRKAPLACFPFFFSETEWFGYFEMLMIVTSHIILVLHTLITIQDQFDIKVFEYHTIWILWLNTMVFECHGIIMVYHVIFYINQSTYIWRQYSKSWYLIDMWKKLVIAIKTLSWSEVSNTLKILWYLANHGIQTRVFYMLVKHLLKKISWYSSIPWFCLKTLKILCFQTPP